MRNKITAILAFALLALGAVAEAGWEEGVAAFKSGNLAQAASEFQAYVQERPDIYQGHFMLGQVLLQLKKNQEALTHLRKAYELDSGQIGVQLALGRAYLDVGRYGDAAGILGKINTSALPGKQQSAVHQMLAKALDKSGDSSRAYGQLAKAAQLEPSNAALQYQYGAAALAQGETRTAVSVLEKAVQLDSGDPAKQAAYAKALVMMGRSTRDSSKVGIYQKAAAAAQKVVAGNASYDNLMLLAGAQLGGKQYDGALATLKQAASKNSGDWLAQYYLGQAYTQKSQYGSAESALRQALDKTSSDKDKVTVWRQLGFVYEKQKNYAEAKAAYGRANDQAGIARVGENQKTAEYNEQVEAENARIQELQAEEDRIKKELQELPGGPPPRS